MELAWQQDLTDSGNLVLCLNMDEAAFFNDGGAESTCNIEWKEHSSLDFYASGDIQIGEEIWYDYSGLAFDPNEMDL